MNGIHGFAEEVRGYVDMQKRAQFARFRVATISPLRVYINDDTTTQVPVEKQKGWTPVVGDTGLAIITGPLAVPICIPTE